jgi:endoglucanase
LAENHGLHRDHSSYQLEAFMIRWLSLTFLILIFTGVLGAQTSGPVNYLRPTWSVLSQAYGTVSVSTDPKVTQSGVPSLVLSSEGDEALVRIGQALDWSQLKGTPLHVSGRLRAEGTFDDGAVAIQALDAKGKIVSWSVACTADAFNSQGWTPFSVSVVEFDRAVAANFVILFNGKGKVWIDSLAVNTVADLHATIPHLTGEAATGPLGAAQAATGTTKPTEEAQARRPNGPTVASVALVGPQLLAVTFASNQIVSTPTTANLDQVKETVEGTPLQLSWAQWVGSYSLSSADDPAYKKPLIPTGLYQKSKPTDWQQPITTGFAMAHTFYLVLPRPLTEGKTYQIDFGSLNVRTKTSTFTFEPAKMLSEPIHVNQVGYRADDPYKAATLSLWLGSGGAFTYPEGMSFHVVDQTDGKAYFAGKVTLVRGAREVEGMHIAAAPRNLNGTNVYTLDFSTLTRPGSYRVVVDGIGASHPFSLGEQTWSKAFVTQMVGFYNQRSGVEVGPPYSTFRKKVDFNPATGAKVLQSTATGGDGAKLARGKTDVSVPEAWGGWMDAGDWNPRRITHAKAAFQILELYELFPDYFGKLNYALPEDRGLPPMVREALFEVDLFKRLQKPDGGIPFAIETNGDPSPGTMSWTSDQVAYVSAPDADSSYFYAFVAARAAFVLGLIQPALATDYIATAQKAFNWAEAQGGPVKWEGRDSRNLAALELYRLTKDPAWHKKFLENTVLTDPNAKIFLWEDHVQRDAAFLYARLDPALADPAIAANARAAVVQQAETALAYGAKNAFRLTTADPGKPQFLGFYGAPDVQELERAHFLTGDSRYLSAALAGCGFSGGSNPTNLTYTTGVGANPIQHPLKLDSRTTGQPSPVGLTVYGNVDWKSWNMTWITWPMKNFLKDVCVPSVWDWPIHERYFDIFLDVAFNEFTMDQTMGPNAYAWGYLAARR